MGVMRFRALPCALQKPPLNTAFDVIPRGCCHVVSNYNKVVLFYYYYFKVFGSAQRGKAIAGWEEASERRGQTHSQVM